MTAAPPLRRWQPPTFCLLGLASAAPPLRRWRRPTFYLLGFASIVLLVGLFAHTASARSIKEILSSGYLTVGIRDDTPPVQFRNSSGSLVGIDPDLATALASTLGVQPRFTLLSGPGDRIPALTGGTVDVVVSSFSVSQARLEQVFFSDAYYETGLAVLIRAEDICKFPSYEKVTGSTVTTKGSTGEEFAKSYMPRTAVLLVSQTNQTYPALESGQANAVVNDRSFLDYYAKDRSSTLAVIPENGTLTVDTYAVGISKSQPDLVTAINAALRSLKASGQLNRIIKKYTGQEPGLVTPPEGGSYYTVSAGDTLAIIAYKFYGSFELWPYICEANRKLINYCNLIEIGWKLRIPDLSNITEAKNGTKMWKRDACVTTGSKTSNGTTTGTSSGMSTGAIAGIAAGGAVVLVAAVAGIVYAVRRNKRAALDATIPAMPVAVGIGPNVPPGQQFGSPPQPAGQPYVDPYAPIIAASPVLPLPMDPPPVYSSGLAAGARVVATITRPPENPDELAITSGDLIVVGVVHDDGWAFGDNMTTGKSGMFPIVATVRENEYLGNDGGVSYPGENI